uniref:F-ATPase protein 6 n=1 Tax=Baltalimania ylvae TaxID=3341436 RepID=A0A1X9WD98_9BILA|nr:ATP synthase F0 subunit 6 [Archaphanostoma ylvae]ARS00900.1 ATP synthase F0 subunit 6 [Archaphanostoma ylvae]
MFIFFSASLDGLFIFLILTIFFFNFFPTSPSQKKSLSWFTSLQGWVNLQVETLILGKESTGGNLMNFTLKSLFIFVIMSNLSGLNMFINQTFMGKLSLSLLIMAIGFWMLSYSPFIHQSKEKFSLFVIGEMKFPSLSFLLSNIEILTHLFRPITLTARLWVNIWVGHLLMSVLSTFFLIMMVTKSNFFFLSIFLLGGFFLFETGIMALQAFVFSYLIGVYWRENLEHSLVTWSH